MVVCIVALVAFSILGIFSARYRGLAKEAFQCVFRMVTLRPCVSKLDQRIRSKLTARLMGRAPGLARVIYTHFSVISWAFTIAFFASMLYSVYGIYNLVVFGSCQPGSACVINQPNQILVFFTCYEAQIVYVVAALAVGILLVYTVVERMKRPTASAAPGTP